MAVRVAQRIGIPLATIRDALATLPDNRTPTRKDWMRLSARWREDLDLMRRLKRHGRVAVLRVPAVTAARRFVERGIARTIATNWSIWALYFVGVDPRRLAKLYPPRSRRQVR